MKITNEEFAIENIDNLKKEYDIFVIFRHGYEGKIISRFSNSMTKTTFILNSFIDYECSFGFGYDKTCDNITKILTRIFTNDIDELERDNFNWYTFLIGRGYIVQRII